MGLPAGRLLDKGYFKPVVGVGVVIYVFRFVGCYFSSPIRPTPEAVMT